VCSAAYNVNCAILGRLSFYDNSPIYLNCQYRYSFGSGIGWFLAIFAMAGIKEKLANERIPKGLQGPGITLIIAGLMALGFVGFAGVLQG